MSHDEVLGAMKKGDLMAAKVIANDAQKRKELEDRYGPEVMRRRFPEAYRKTSETAFGRFVDRIKLMW